MEDQILSQLRQTKKRIAIECDQSSENLLELLNRTVSEFTKAPKAKRQKSTVSHARSTPKH
jgi:hypothetical protein